MDHFEFIGLRAKIRAANNYLDQVLIHRGKIDNYDICKVVTPAMREFVTIVEPEVAKLDGDGIIRLKEAV